MRVSSSGGTTLVFNDSFFNVRDTGLLVRPKVTPMARTFLVASKRALRSHFERLAAIEGLARIIPGHGDIIAENPAEILRRVASTL
jgi:hypothetical protein